MPRRVSLPGASELFRDTQPGDGVSPDAEPGADQLRAETGEEAVTEGTWEGEEQSGSGNRKPSTGRVRHDEKITVYVSTGELLALEQTRLRLRADHDTAVDRGRIVREAVSIALADFVAEGENSELVRRLSTS